MGRQTGPGLVGSHEGMTRQHRRRRRDAAEARHARARVLSRVNDARDHLHRRVALAVGVWVCGVASGGCVPAAYRVDPSPLVSTAPDTAPADEVVCDRFASHIRALTFDALWRRSQRVQEDPPTTAWMRQQADHAHETALRTCRELGTVGAVRCALTVTRLETLASQCERAEGAPVSGRRGYPGAVNRAML